MAEGNLPMRMREGTRETSRQSENLIRKRETEKQLKELEQQIKEEELKRLKYQLDIMRSRRAASNTEHTNVLDFASNENERNVLNTSRQSVQKLNSDVHHSMSSIEQIGAHKQSEQEHDPTDIILNASGVEFLNQVDDIDARISLHRNESYHTPDRISSDISQRRKVHTDILKERKERLDRDKGQSKSFDTVIKHDGDGDWLKARVVYQTPTYSEKQINKCIDTTKGTKTQTEYKDEENYSLPMKSVRNRRVSDLECMFETKEERSITSEFMEEEERKLSLITDRRKELQEMIEMERLQQLKIEQEKQRKMEEIREQERVLEQYELRSRELQLRENKLKDYEKMIDSKMERLHLISDTLEKENIERKRENDVSETLKKKYEEMRRREMAIEKKEKELEQKDYLLEKKINLLKDWQHEERETERVPQKYESDIHDMMNDYLEEGFHTLPRQSSNEIHTFGPKLIISQFSGSDPKPRSESSLEEWKREIESIIATKLYKEHVVAQAIRQSLRGQAKKVLINLSPVATPIDIVSRVEDIFGDLSSQQIIFTEFYTAEQKPEESVAEWGLRLEEILLLASTKRFIPEKERKEMLKDKFWRSLYNIDIKNATRTSFESSDSFEVLRRKARAEENEIKVTKQRRQTVQHNQMSTVEKDNKEDIIKQLMKKMENLERQLEEVKREKEKPSRYDTSNQYSYGGRGQYNFRRTNNYNNVGRGYGFRYNSRYNGSVGQNRRNEMDINSRKETNEKDPKIQPDVAKKNVKEDLKD
ncbi:golgin subfamily A member 6-like protein 22 [Ruditapes philippinarum]|uniref:golgin subfamily A member 6-like protein 22 n=1 Tax=Ruditapes philippinarum TaxID=129788 RepID=UPI00295A5723|nr:golgin subfamily A member 6-like protein 22 [Ruditapes philippinarum]